MKALTTAEATIGELAARVERLEQHAQRHCPDCRNRVAAIADTLEQAGRLEAEARRCRKLAAELAADPLSIAVPMPREGR